MSIHASRGHLLQSAGRIHSMREEHHSNQRFDGIAGDELDALALEPTPHEFQPGDVIFREGEPGSSFYLIAEGTVRISKGEGEDAETLDLIEAGQVFGEMAVIDGKPRSASAIAETACRLGEIDTAGFEHLRQLNGHIVGQTKQS